MGGRRDWVISRWFHPTHENSSNSREVLKVAYKELACVKRNAKAILG